MNKSIFYRLIGITVTTIILLAMISGFAGCKAVEKYKQSPEFPADCAKEFPIKTDSIYIQGEEIHDTVTNYEYGNSDTVIMVIDSIKTQIIYTDRVLTKTIIKSRTDTIRTEKESTAAIEAIRRTAKMEIESLSDEIVRLDNQAGKDAKKIDWLAKQRNISFGIITLAGLYLFRHQIISLFSGWFGFLASFIKRKKQ